VSRCAALWRAMALVATLVAAPAGAAAAEASEGSPAAAAAGSRAVVVQPRAFGYVIGDIATQRILLEVNGRSFVAESLPSKGRANVWFERHEVRTETDARGRRWLVIDYQLMNAPRSVAVAPLPALKLNAKDSAGTLQVSAWPLSVSPLTPEKPLTPASLGALRPDRSAVPVQLFFTERALTLSVIGLLATLAAWLAWWFWRNWRASASLPFAVASREIRALDDTSPEAWHALHRAFDGTAGRTIRSETLPVLFEKAPQLQPCRALIEQFYAQSALRFFAGQTPSNVVPIHALCRDLCRIEKRYES
jgi:mxaA protein